MPQPEATAGGLVAPGGPGLAPPATWKAVIIKHPWRSEDQNVPRRVRDDEKSVYLQPGEKGISMNTKTWDDGSVWHRVHFERYNVSFFGEYLVMMQLDGV
jgi:hypothetical protein